MKVLAGFLKLMAIYVGIVAGVLFSLYGLDLIHRGELLVPEFFAILFANLVTTVQISVLLGITALLTKTFRANLFFSALVNIALGFVFSLGYLTLLILISPKFKITNNMVTEIFLIPIAVFLPLLFVYNQILRAARRKIS